MQMSLHVILFKKSTTLTHILNKWFHDHYMVLNPRKCYYMSFGLNTTKNEFVFEDGTIVPSAEDDIVLITVDSLLAFYSHLKQLRKKLQINALKIIAP